MFGLHVFKLAEKGDGAYDHGNGKNKGKRDENFAQHCSPGTQLQSASENRKRLQRSQGQGGIAAADKPGHQSDHQQAQNDFIIGQQIQGQMFVRQLIEYRQHHLDDNQSD